MLMNKDLKISYILFFIFSGILIAWKTLSNFLGGVAINFVALLGLTFVIVVMSFNNKSLLRQVIDLFIASCVFCVLELVIYFACEFGYGEFLLGFYVYQNIISFLGILFAAYICFRFLVKYTNKKIKFIEIMEGNEKRKPKEKKTKELSNGSLEDKPNNKTIEEQTSQETENETEIIIETEE